MKNEPAYPTQEVRDINGNGIMEGCYGLTKRELFAAMAMQGVLSGYWSDMNASGVNSQQAAIYAKDYADALIKELSK